MPGFSEIIVILVVVLIVIATSKFSNIAAGMIKMLEKVQGKKNTDPNQNG